MTIKVPMILERHPDRPQSGLKAIGYWSQKDPPKGDGLGLAMYVANGLLNGPFPNPHQWVDESWDEEIRGIVANYVRYTEMASIHRGWKQPEGPGAVRVLHRWRGGSWCRFECGERHMGSVCLTDGVYAWPQGFVHYIEEHHVRPPEVFVDHVLDMIERQNPEFQAMLAQAVDEALKDIKADKLKPVNDIRKWFEDQTGVDLDAAQTAMARKLQRDAEKKRRKR